MGGSWATLQELWAALGRLRAGSWAALDSFWAAPGGPWAALVQLCAAFRLLSAALGGLWMALGQILASFGAALGQFFGGYLGGLQVGFGSFLAPKYSEKAKRYLNLTTIVSYCFLHSFCTI